MNVAHAGRPHAPEMLKDPGQGRISTTLTHPNAPRMKFQTFLARIRIHFPRIELGHAALDFLHGPAPHGK